MKLLTLLLCLLALGACVFKTKKCKGPRVAILQIAEGAALNAARQGLVDTLVAQGFSCPKELCGKVPQRRSDSAQKTLLYDCGQGAPPLCAAIARKFVSEQVDVVVAIGTPAAQAFLGEAACPPMVFLSVTEPKTAGLTGKSHVTGVSDATSAQAQLEYFKSIKPELKTLGMISNPSEINSSIAVQETQEAAKALGITIKVANASKVSEVAGAAQALAGDCQALFVNNDNTALAALPAVITAANAHKIPVFCSDLDTLEQGVSAALGPDQYALGVQAAKQVLAILEGVPVESIMIAYPEKTQGQELRGTSAP